MLKSTGDQVADLPAARMPPGGEKAALRSAMYALCSDLVGSPVATAEGISLAASAADLVTLLPGLPFAIQLPELTLAALDTQLNDAPRCRRQYGALFEPGDAGPAIAIRESLALARDTGVRERLLQLFDSCGYAVDETHDWPGDHISMQLAFLHWLCFQEAQAADPDRRGAWQRAQRDFLAGHVLNWLPALARKVALMAPAGPYKQIFSSVHALAAGDLAYCQARMGCG